MTIAATIKNFLDAEGLDYQVIAHPAAATAQQAALLAGVDASSVAQMQAVKDWRGSLLAVFPADHELNLEVLNRQLRRDLVVAPLPTPLPAFLDAATTVLPPLPAVYGLRTIIDSSLRGIDPIYFRAGHTALIRVSARGFALLQTHAWHGEHIAQRSTEPGGALEPLAPNIDLVVVNNPAAPDLKTRIERLDSLPAVPEMAQRILQLRANPYASADDLANIVARDPSLAAQVIRYASSPLFGYRGKLNSIQDAISRVLGYDMVMDIAFGIAAASAFRLPNDGPIGLSAFWRDAVYCAALCQALCKLLPPTQRLRPGLAYLAGLLHDFGLLLFGQLYPAEFADFNTAFTKAPQDFAALERRQLTVSHTAMGAWIMEAWQMPVEIITAVREHHNPDYDGVYAGYPHLVRLAKHLLNHQHIGIPDADGMVGRSLEWLGMTEFQAHGMLQSVVAGALALDDMAQQIAA